MVIHALKFSSLGVSFGVKYWKQFALRTPSHTGVKEETDEEGGTDEFVYYILMVENRCAFLSLFCS